MDTGDRTVQDNNECNRNKLSTKADINNNNNNNVLIGLSVTRSLLLGLLWF